MLWFTLWFMVILKIPIVYLGWVIWWAVKDPPEPGLGPAAESFGSAGDGPGGWSRTRPARVPGRRPGPHGSPVRRPVRAAVGRRRERA
jgi:hypothetical protein